ncbi:MAG: RNA polymerase-binding protein RbpA [Actinomycetota bacterium]|nr:RNA polymerase-binding protein RbpA [Actinomycetota bacterium]
MAERVLRGARLGTQSFEDERGVEMAPRQQVTYVTDSGHEFQVTMSIEADIPTEWESPSTAEIGRRVGGFAPEVKKGKPARTHWDMLLERRSVDELEEILSERLQLLRGGEIGPAHLHKPTRSRKKTA